MSAPLRGDSAIRWTEDGQDYLHYLGGPVKNPTANPVQQVHRWRSADLTTERVISIGSGVQDLSCTLPWDGNPDSLVRLIAAGRRGATLEVFPSLANPSLSFPCVLVEAGDIGPDPQFWHARRHQVDVRLRRIDGGSWQALLEAPLFYWRAGQALQGLTFTRSGAVGTAADENGVVQDYAANVIRTDWPLVGGVRVPTTPLENARTNLVLQSEDFGTTWGTVGTPTLNVGAGPHTASGVSLDLIGDDDGAAAEYYTQTVTFGSDGNRSISIHVKKGENPPAGGSLLVLRDTTAGVSRLSATLTWTSGAPSLAFTAGAEVRDATPLADGVYRLHLRATGVVAANTNQAQVRPTTSTASETGDVYAGGVQAENSTVTSSYIRTTTGTVSRGVEAFSADFVHAPQAMTLYAKLRAGIVSGGGSNAVVIHLGSGTAGADPRLLIFDGPNGYRAAHDNGTASVTTADTLTAVTLDDPVEFRLVVNADGSLLLGQSIDEATEGVTATTAANALQDAWAGTRLYLNSVGASNVGLNAFEAVKVMPGVLSLAAMRGL